MARTRDAGVQLVAEGTDTPRERLAAAIAALPRVSLAQLPTPLERLNHLGDAWGLPDLWIKRDDLSGLAFGGNKARKLEFVAAHAQQKGARILITGGRTQSNHARDTAIVAKRLGMDAALLLSGTKPDPPTGNVLLSSLMGVEMVWGKTDREALRRGAALMAKYTLAGRRPYMVPAGASNARGTVGYVNAVLELVEQCRHLNEPLPDAIILAGGTGGTIAGLVAGCRLLELPTRVIGICVIEPPYARPPVIAKLATAACRLLKCKHVTVRPEDVHVEDGFVGDGYAVSTPESEAAITTMARHEGIFLDPVYTAKALAGLHGLVARGVLTAEQRILFWHTGGAVGLFR